MGYSTDFSGELTPNKPFTPEQIEYINRFSGTRRMKRDNEKLMELYQGRFGLPGLEGIEAYGTEGEYFCNDIGYRGQKDDESVLEYNYPPSTQPDLWCQWVIEDDVLTWDGGEKFYHYVEWLEYLIENFFSRWGILLSGEIKWRGEEFSDIGTIKVENNLVTVKELNF